MTGIVLILIGILMISGTFYNQYKKDGFKFTIVTLALAFVFVSILTLLIKAFL